MSTPTTINIPLSKELKTFLEAEFAKCTGVMQKRNDCGEIIFLPPTEVRDEEGEVILDDDGEALMTQETPDLVLGEDGKVDLNVPMTLKEFTIRVIQGRAHKFLKDSHTASFNSTLPLA